MNEVIRQLEWAQKETSVDSYKYLISHFLRNGEKMK
jgi:hypothetical protein